MSKSIDKRATELLAFAKERAPQCSTWVELSNLVFGPGGPVMRLFPSESDRAKLVETPEHAAIWEIFEAMPEGETADAREDHSGKILVRVPKSIHAALLAEAESEGVSLNQLILSKLCVQLQAVV